MIRLVVFIDLCVCICVSYTDVYIIYDKICIVLYIKKISFFFTTSTGTWYSKKCRLYVFVPYFYTAEC